MKLRITLFCLGMFFSVWAPNEELCQKPCETDSMYKARMALLSNAAKRAATVDGNKRWSTNPTPTGAAKPLKTKPFSGTGFFSGWSSGSGCGDGSGDGCGCADGEE